MTNHAGLFLPSVDATALSWVLRRGDSAITTEIHVTPERMIEVSFVPHWDESHAVSRGYAQATAALEEHARIVARLQESGWVVAAHRQQPSLVAA